MGVLIAALSLAAASGQQLTVKSATAKQVQLQWTAATGSASLERSSGQAFQKVAPGDGGAYTDSTVDAFGTYKYRINSGGKFSNVVTVGPPPAGVSNAAPAPKGTAYENYGPATAIALDENGDPVIAFERIDPNGDGDKSDTEIRFVRWDRATYKWTQPVKVATTGPLADQNVDIIAVACDHDSGALAILVAAAEQVKYAVSSDHGATWTNSTVNSPGGASPHAVALAVAGGQAYAVVNGEDAAAYLTGSVSNASAWKSKAIPPAGWAIRNNANIALILNGDGKPALAYYQDHEGDQHRYVFWRPEGGAPTVITGNANTDLPDIALSFGNGQFGALFSATLDEKDTDHTIWYSQSTDGSSWSKPSKLPVDGPRSSNPPLGLALDSKGSVTAAFGSNSGSGGAACGAPVVSRSTDGTAWKTCGLGKAAGVDFGPQPSTLHAIEAPNDRAYVVWQEQTETKYQPGVLIWHEK